MLRRTRRTAIVLLPMAFFYLRNLSLLTSFQEYQRMFETGKETVRYKSNQLAELGKNVLDVYQDVITGSPASTIISFANCSCELVSIDCLDTIACLPDPQARSKRIKEGTIKRRALKRTTTFIDARIKDDYDWAPMGKSMQSISIKLWHQWMINNRMPIGFVSRNESFINETLYPYCKTRGLRGRACFFSEFGAAEEFGVLEEKAIDAQGKGTHADFAKAETELRSLRDDPYNVSPYSYLMHFSHVSRIALNIRRFLIDIYEKRLRSIPSKDAHSNILRVACHIRRGDACGHSLSGYSPVASLLNSMAQFSNSRLCYKTSVYMEALNRVRSIAIGRHLEVYIATDHLMDLMTEIKNDFPSLYKAVTWKFVEYSRDLFNYSQGLFTGENFIEWSPNMPELGETAVVDIWHLSHGEVFIGHLGSRFGKLSWWQALARHNSFVPFFSVDGHSVCCEIDEACGRVSAAIVSMENCLAFARDDSNFRGDPETYWTEGSMVRFQAADFEAEQRSKRYKQTKP